MVFFTNSMSMKLLVIFLAQFFHFQVTGNLVQFLIRTFCKSVLLILRFHSISAIYWWSSDDTIYNMTIYADEIIPFTLNAATVWVVCWCWIRPSKHCWLVVGNDLLISMEGKCSLLYLIIQVTLLLLMEYNFSKYWDFPFLRICVVTPELWLPQCRSATFTQQH